MRVTGKRTSAARARARVPMDASPITMGHAAILVAAMMVLVLLVRCSPYRQDWEWQRSYNFGFAEPAGLVPQPDSGFTICGWRYTDDSASAEVGIHVVRCNRNADTLWTRLLLSGEHIWINAACAGPDKGCYVGGWSSGMTSIIARLDANGDTVWVRRLSRDQYGFIVYAISSTPDGGVLAAECDPGEPPFLLRLSPQGDSLWTTTCNDSTISSIMAICPTADGWYLAGCTKEYRACVMRVGQQGERIWFWQRNSDTIETVLKSVTLAPDGGAIACGYQATTEINSGVFVRLSPEGESVATRIVRSPQQWYGRIIPYGDGYVTVGSMTEGYRWLVAIERLSADGAVLDLKRFASSEDNYGYDVIAGADDWLYAVGCSWPNKYFDIIHTRF